MLSRLLFGARWTLAAALLASIIAALPGVLLGIVAGYFEGPLTPSLAEEWTYCSLFPACCWLSAS
jgi:ABC-type dipeptide/oligopeptide/nickel transport system permease subunit